MYDIQLSQYCGGIVGKDHLLEMVDDELVTAIRSERCLYSGGDGSAGVDVAYYSAIFCVVAMGLLVAVP
jgi:hypothetical protein